MMTSKISFNPLFKNWVENHLDDKTVFSVNRLSIFLKKLPSVDPVKNNNQLLNKIMISLDKFIQQNDYSKLMGMNIIIDDFYKNESNKFFTLKFRCPIKNGKVYISK